MLLQEVPHQPRTQANRIDVPGGELNDGHGVPYPVSMPISGFGGRAAVDYRTL
jgi:hypothetical protein